MIPADEPGNKTVMIYNNIQFDVAIDQEVFTVDYMKRLEMIYLKLAWRNLWRNRRHLHYGGFALLRRAAGHRRVRPAGRVYGNMIRNMAGLQPVTCRCMAMATGKKKIWIWLFRWMMHSSTNSIKQKGITGVMPRIESFALASTGEVSSCHAHGHRSVREDAVNNLQTQNPKRKTICCE